VETLRVEDPVPVMEVGPKDAVAPAGRPLTPSATAELKPEIAAVEAV